MSLDQDPTTAEATPIPTCPKCQGDMWDNRASKRNPRAPDFKCKNKECDGVVWPPRDPNAGPPKPAGTADDPACPVCGGKMWDDRTSKRNPRAPDFKCRNKPKYQGGPGCEGVIWPPRDGEQRAATATAPAARGAAPSARPARAEAPPAYDAPPPDDGDFGGFDDEDDLPF